jgi:hypothetical protein
MTHMPSYQISLTPTKRAAGRFIAAVRREIQKAFAEERACSGMTQAAIANALEVHRSVIHRQIVGHENLTLGRVGEIACVLGRDIVFHLVKPEECSNHFFPAPIVSCENAPPQSAGISTVPASGVVVTPISNPGMLQSPWNPQRA